MASHADDLRGSLRVPSPRGAGTRDEPLRTRGISFVMRGVLCAPIFSQLHRQKTTALDR